MTDIETIVYGGLAGVIIYIVGQLLSKFFIEPLNELRKEVGNVRFCLSFHAAVIHTPAARNECRTEAASKSLIECSSNLIAKSHGVPLYFIIRCLARLPKKEKLEEATIWIRGLSTYMHEKGEKAIDNVEVINKRVEMIERNLGLDPLE